MIFHFPLAANTHELSKPGGAGKTSPTVTLDASSDIVIDFCNDAFKESQSTEQMAHK